MRKQNKRNKTRTVINNNKLPLVPAHTNNCEQRRPHALIRYRYRSVPVGTRKLARITTAQVLVCTVKGTGTQHEGGTGTLSLTTGTNQCFDSLILGPGNDNKKRFFDNLFSAAFSTSRASCCWHRMSARTDWTSLVPIHRRSCSGCCCCCC